MIVKVQSWTLLPPFKSLNLGPPTFGFGQTVTRNKGLAMAYNSNGRNPGTLSVQFAVACAGGAVQANGGWGFEFGPLFKEGGSRRPLTEVSSAGPFWKVFKLACCEC